MRLAAISLVALAAAVAAGGADASFPAAKGRLVLVAENAGGGAAAPALRRDDGGLTPIGIPVGIHGSATLSADGTQVALVSTIDFFPDLTTPTLIVGDLLGGFEDLSVGRARDAQPGRRTDRGLRTPATREAATGTSTSRERLPARRPST